MGYLVRIINQNLSQCEQSKNYSLEGEDYTILMKVENTVLSTESETPFEKLLREFKEEKQMPVLKREDIEPIIGFVLGKNRTHPIHLYEVAYIVNDKGQTLERIYGQYNKY